MTFRQLFSPCLFGHAPDPLTVVRGKVMRHECRRCCADLGAVLKGQRFKARKLLKLVRKPVLKISDRKVG